MLMRTLVTMSVLVTAVGAAEPEVYVDLRPHFERFGLPPRAQGGRGTCSVFTVVAGIEYANACRTRHGTPLSVEYLNWAANQVSGDRGDGSFFLYAWQGYEQHGLCPDADLPYAKAFDVDLQPPAATVGDAHQLLAPRLVAHWIRPHGAKQGLTDAEVATLRQVLRSGWPICCGSGHSVLYVGYHRDPDFPGWASFLTRDSGLGGYGSIPVYEAKRILYDIFWIEAPGVRPPAPASTPPDNEQPKLRAETGVQVRGGGLAPVWQVQAGAAPLHHLVFSSDGRMVAASKRGSPATSLWNVRTGRRVALLADGALSAAFSPDGKLLATGHVGEIRLRDAASGRVLQTLKGHSDWIESLAWSPDGRWLASGSGDRSVRLWDAATRACKAVLTGHTGPVGQVGFSPRSTKLWSAGWEHAVRVWDCATGVLEATLPDSGAAGFTPDGARLLSARGDRLETLSLPGLQAVAAESAAAPVTACASSPDGRLIAWGTAKGGLCVRRADGTGRPTEVELGHPANVLSFSPDSRRLAVGAAAGVVTLLDCAPRQ
ncbi:MAG: PD40 domain-containing protein [Armatimonadetes bacterium]|nr:PD40 domain-containing protein [Armatimonadota bacterium]